MKRKIINQEETRQRERIISLLCRVLGNVVLEKARLDAILEAYSQDRNFAERLELIASRINEAVEGMIILLPEEERKWSYESAEFTLWRLQYDLARQKSPIGERFTLFGKVVTVDMIPSHSKKVFEQENGFCCKEFNEMKMTNEFMTDIIRMMTVLKMEEKDFGNSPKVMDKLLVLVDAALRKTAKFWEKWKPIAEKAQAAIPLEDTLKGIYISEGKMRVYDNVYRKLLPEVIAKNCVTNFNAFPKFEHEVVELINPESTKVVLYYMEYLHTLYALEYDLINYSEDSFEELVHELYERFYV
ncbi:hypothetical protein [Roseburia inulinivorans]